MNDLEAGLRRVVSDLTELRLGFALVGGFAVSVRAEPRLTRDIDVVVAVTSDAEAEAAVAALGGRGYTIAASIEHEATRRLASVRLVHAPGEREVLTDVLFASSGIEQEIVAAADVLEVVAGLEVPVATVGHLLAMKLLAQDDRSRPADADDLRSLAAVASERDWGAAADAVTLITDRGYARGRDLHDALARVRPT